MYATVLNDTTPLTYQAEIEGFGMDDFEYNAIIDYQEEKSFWGDPSSFVILRCQLEVFPSVWADVQLDSNRLCDLELALVKELKAAGEEENY